MTDSSPLVSAIMPAYNAAEFVRAAIESVLAQTYPRLELIVVDDGSTDGTAAIVEQVGGRVRCIRQPNARQAAARNRGARAAQGNYLAFIDADDLWRADKIEKQMALALGDPELAFVYCGVDHVDIHGRFVCSRPGAIRGRALEAILLGEPIGGLCGSTMLMSRSRFEELGGFDEDLPPCEDTDLWVRAAARRPIDHVDEPLALHRLHDDNQHRRPDLMARAWIALYRKSLRHPEVVALGWTFRVRCHARLCHLLSAIHAQESRWIPAGFFALASFLAWPPRAVQRLTRFVTSPARRQGVG